MQQYSQAYLGFDRINHHHTGWTFVLPPCSFFGPAVASHFLILEPPLFWGGNAWKVRSHTSFLALHP